MPITEPTIESEPLPVFEPGLRTVSSTVWIVRASLARRSSAVPPRASTLASPQSTTCTSPNAPTMMLAGFRSRWMTPRLWA